MKNPVKNVLVLGRRNIITDGIYNLPGLAEMATKAGFLVAHAVKGGKLSTKRTKSQADSFSPIGGWKIEDFSSCCLFCWDCKFRKEFDSDLVLSISYLKDKLGGKMYKDATAQFIRAKLFAREFLGVNYLDSELSYLFELEMVFREKARGLLFEEALKNEDFDRLLLTATLFNCHQHSLLSCQEFPVTTFNELDLDPYKGKTSYMINSWNAFRNNVW